MKEKLISLNFITTTLLILLVISSRFFSPTYGFTPILSIGIFGGALFMNKKWAYIIPILAIWLSDLFINNVVYSQFNEGFIFLYDGWYWQYGMYLLIPFLSILMFRNKITVGKVLGMSVGTPVLFFLITNFGTWLTSGLYPLSMEGLTACFIMAVPFFKGYALGTLAYSTLLFGSYYFIEKHSVLALRSKFSKSLI